MHRALCANLHVGRRNLRRALLVVDDDHPIPGGTRLNWRCSWGQSQRPWPAPMAHIVPLTAGADLPLNRRVQAAPYQSNRPRLDNLRVAFPPVRPNGRVTKAKGQSPQAGFIGIDNRHSFFCFLTDLLAAAPVVRCSSVENKARPINIIHKSTIGTTMGWLKQKRPHTMCARSIKIALVIEVSK